MIGGNCDRGMAALIFSLLLLAVLLIGIGISACFYMRRRQRYGFTQQQSALLK